MTTVQTSAGNISVIESAGKGRTVLFVHGNSSCKEIFKHQFEGDLAEKYHCIALDLPGHGESSNAIEPELHYVIPNYAKIIYEVMDKLDIESCVVVGWSLGGNIALEMMGQSERLKGLFISGAPPAGLEDMGDAFRPTEAMQLTGLDSFSEEQAFTYAEAICGGEVTDALVKAVRRTDGRSREIMIKGVMAEKGLNQRNIVEDSPTPLAIVNGELDPFLNHHYFESLQYKNLWQGKIHRISEAGHAPFWTHPIAFNALLDEFLRELN